CPDRTRDRGLQRRQAVLVDPGPDVTHPGEIEALVGNRLGAVVDKEKEAPGETAETEEPEQEAHHGCLSRSRKTFTSVLRLTPLALPVQLPRPLVPSCGG